MWGFYNRRNNNVANTIYDNLIDLQISCAHKKGNELGQDQIFPKEYIFPFIKDISMSHDSYFCEDTKLRTSDTRPFPTKRDGACWVGIWYVSDIDCRVGNPWRIWYDFRCPKECRPQKHQDWSTC